MKRFLPLILALCAAFPAKSQEPKRPPAPSAVTAPLPKSAISLRWQRVSASPEVWAQLWCIPRGHSRERETMLSEKRSGPVRRADIDSGPSVEPSPFTLELFSNQASGWKALGKITFEQTKDVQEIHTRYLDPATKKQPVLVMHFGFTHWHEWELFTMPRGWGNPIARQTFLWGGEGGSSVSQDFSGVRAGRMVIREEEVQDERTARGTYAWNGREWIDPSQKWLVVGASGTQSAMQLLAARKKLGEARPSSEFSRLKPGAWIWLMARYRREFEAREHVQALRRENVAAQVRLAR